VFIAEFAVCAGGLGIQPIDFFYHKAHTHSLRVVPGPWPESNVVLIAGQGVLRAKGESKELLALLQILQEVSASTTKTTNWHLRSSIQKILFAMIHNGCQIEDEPIVKIIEPLLSTFGSLPCIVLGILG
jgi:hypothetical protein